VKGWKNDRLQPGGNRLEDLLPKLVVPLAILVLWIVVSEFRLVRPIFVPPPEDMWKAFLGMYTLLPQAILTTLASALASPSAWFRVSPWRTAKPYAIS
jgi:ABC-type nitrate/sulfonate/bicarbonate transport system permease component